MAWYDTRWDLSGPNDDVKIALYYAVIKDNNDCTFGVTEVELDREAIDTSYLSNPKFIGDRIDIALTKTPNPEAALIVYMGTEHPRVGQTPAPQDDEAIFSFLVFQ